MPAIRSYTVTQTRVVTVDANTPEDAARIAAFAFQNGQDSSYGVKNTHAIPANSHPLYNVWGNTTKAIEVTGLIVEKLR